MGNTFQCPVFKFTLSHANLGSLVISEPMNWKDAKLKMERHPTFYSLVEYFEGSFIFYGENNIDNGGADFIRQCENLYGFSTEIQILIEADIDGDGVFEETIFDGQLDLTQLKETNNNQIEVPIIRNSLWSKFIARLDVPVNFSSAVDLDGNAITPIHPVDINLTCQKIRKQYQASGEGVGVTDEDVNVIVSGTYYQMSWNKETLSELKEIFVLPQVTNTEVPAAFFVLKEAGNYSFTLETNAYDYTPGGGGGFNFSAGEDISDYIRFYININGTETEFTVGDLFESDNTAGGRFYTLNLQNQDLTAGSLISVYGKAIADLTATPSFAGQIRWNGTDTGNISINHGALEDITFTASIQITGDTTFPSSEAKGYLIHDAFAAVVQAITGSNCFYSEIFGRTDTNARQYDSNGCFSKNMLLKGLQVRGYTLEEKPFFASFNDLWNGADPMFCLGLGYSNVDGVAGEVIRLEKRDHFFNPGTP